MKLLSELIVEVEQYLAARGNAPNVVAQYHYIFQVFLAYFQTFHESFYSETLMAQCLKEHYGITDSQKLARRQGYKRKVVRASRLIRDCAAGKGLSDRYTVTTCLLLTDHFNAALSEFGEHLIKIGRSQKTIHAYRQNTARFLNFVEHQGIHLVSNISAETINNYTITLSGLNKSTVKSLLGPVRIFLRFLYTNGDIAQNLSQFVGTVKVRSQTKIPSVWTKEEVLKLLAAIDRGNPSGKRDYAIILLIARLGPRVSDVNNLKFENIDWNKKCISFIQHKTGNPVCLPLLKDVGWAIIDYVKNGRPNIDLQLTKDMFPDIREKIEAYYSSLNTCKGDDMNIRPP